MTRIEALEVLNLKDTASLEDIKNAYSELSKNCHPEEDPDRFNELHEAFSYLYRSERRNSRRKAVFEEKSNIGNVFEERSNADDTIRERKDTNTAFSIDFSRYSIEAMTGISDNGEENENVESDSEFKQEKYNGWDDDSKKHKYVKPDSNSDKKEYTEQDKASESDEHKRVIYRLKEDIGDELDLDSILKAFEEKIREEDAFYEMKQKEALVEEAIKLLKQLYNKALNDPIRNSYSCMNELFKVYNNDVYKSKRFLDELIVILSDKRLDNSIHMKVAEFYGFIGIGAFVKNVPAEQQKVYDAVKERWTPSKNSSLFMLGLGFFMQIEMSFIIVRGISNKVIAVSLLAILVFGFVINENYFSKHKYGFRREMVTAIMAGLALVVFFIGKALGTFDGMKMSDSRRSAWDKVIVLILGGIIIWNLFMYYRNLRSRNLV